jgi:hypothetical protein
VAVGVVLVDRRDRGAGERRRTRPSVSGSVRGAAPGRIVNRPFRVPVTSQPSAATSMLVPLFTPTRRLAWTAPLARSTTATRRGVRAITAAWSPAIEKGANDPVAHGRRTRAAPASMIQAGTPSRCTGVSRMSARSPSTSAENGDHACAP